MAEKTLDILPTDWVSWVHTPFRHQYFFSPADACSNLLYLWNLDSLTEARQTYSHTKSLHTDHPLIPRPSQPSKDRSAHQNAYPPTPPFTDANPTFLAHPTKLPESSLDYQNLLSIQHPPPCPLPPQRRKLSRRRVIVFSHRFSDPRETRLFRRHRVLQLRGCRHPLRRSMNGRRIG